jgi:hypothetical protein
MIGTDRDLAKMREAIDYELFRLITLRKMPLGTTGVDEIAVEIAKLHRERVALCAAIANRRAEASRSVVSFARWANGNGALDALWSTRRGGCDAPIPPGQVTAPNSHRQGA